MSTSPRRSTTTDEQVRRTLVGLLALILPAGTALYVTLLWFTSLDCPKLWHVLAGPVALAVVVALMVRGLRRLHDLDEVSAA
ncbi:hypothetical protein V2J56_09040 [Georgenia sp. MJ206]|uniref:hypothetical protein n=1 Tax=Georgenia wangjunii TaxID=3117730 RepID=UPI002F267F63